MYKTSIKEKAAATIKATFISLVCAIRFGYLCVSYWEICILELCNLFITDFIMLHWISRSWLLNIVNMVIIGCACLKLMWFTNEASYWVTHIVYTVNNLWQCPLKRGDGGRERERPEGGSWRKSCSAKLVSKQQPTNGWIIFTEIFSNCFLHTFLQWAFLTLELLLKTNLTPA